MIVKPIKTRIFNENEDLVEFIVRHVKKIPEKNVLVVTSKIVALSEGRTAIVKNKKQIEGLIKSESEQAIKTKHVWLSLKDGMLLANAGVDESNAKGKLILLPKNSYRSAENLRNKLQKKYKVKKLGILIIDSKTTPLRAGVTAVALGYAGFRGLRDYRGKADIFGRKFTLIQTNVADCLATAAVFMMGEGNEKMPLAIIQDAPIEFTEKVDPKALNISLEDDMYGPLLSRFRKS